MNSTDLLNAFRDEMSDAEAPYLWSDAFVYRAIDDAQKMFCRLTDGIADSRTVGVTQLAVVPNTEWYALSPLILKVRKAARADNGRKVDIVNSESADKLGVRFDGSTGPVKALVAGLEKNSLRAWPKPNETVTLSLSVFRLPLAAITAGAQALEVDEQHHYHLLTWVKHLAYLKEDSEAFDRRKAEELERSFDAYCDRAKREQTRARREVGTTIYGGL